MSTLDRLIADEKIIRCPSMDKEDCKPIRSMFLTVEFDRWLNDLLDTHPDRGDEGLMDQVLTKIQHYIASPKVDIGIFRKENFVWCMHTVDLRIFGFFYRPGVFIAVCGEKKMDIKGTSYGSYYSKTQRVADGLGLDPPPYMTKKNAMSMKYDWERMYAYSDQRL